MPIIFDENTIGMWFVPLSDPPKYADWMGSARWAAEDDTVDFTYRFRYSDNDNPWDENDKKHWYEAKVAATSQEAAIEKIQKMVAAIIGLAPLAGYTPRIVDELIREPGEPLESFIKRFRKRPYVHEQAHSIQ